MPSLRLQPSISLYLKTFVLASVGALQRGRLQFFIVSPLFCAHTAETLFPRVAASRCQVNCFTYVPHLANSRQPFPGADLTNQLCPHHRFTATAGLKSKSWRNLSSLTHSVMKSRGGNCSRESWLESHNSQTKINSGLRLFFTRTTFY